MNNILIKNPTCFCVVNYLLNSNKPTCLYNHNIFFQINVMSLDAFPTEILLRIFSFLDFPYLKSAVLVCRRWHHIIYRLLIRNLSLSSEELIMSWCFNCLWGTSHLKFAPWLGKFVIFTIHKKTWNCFEKISYNFLFFVCLLYRMAIVLF